MQGEENEGRMRKRVQKNQCEKSKRKSQRTTWTTLADLETDMHFNKQWQALAAPEGGRWRRPRGCKRQAMTQAKRVGEAGTGTGTG
jgi:hypothetical protein